MAILTSEDSVIGQRIEDGLAGASEPWGTESENIGSSGNAADPDPGQAGRQGGALNQLLSPANLRRAQRLADKLPPRWSRRTRELGKQILNYRGARSTMARGMLFWYLGRLTPLVATPFGDGKILVDTSDQEISRVVFMRGEYERLYMAAAVDYLRAELGRPVGPLFVDVGANIGVSALDALLHFGFQEAMCFEPDSRSFRILQANLLLNDLDGRAQAHQVALSDKEGESLLQRSRTNFGDSRLLAPGERPEGELDAERCATRRLDAFFEDERDLDGRVGLLWIDAQGHEPQVLAGCPKLLASGAPVVLEYWPKGLRASGGLERFEALVADGFSSVVDLRRLCAGERSDARMPAGSIAALRSRYLNAEFTDLLLIR
ncbi:MAG TPA: FkbM family methyltransferase [Actinomycetota bacterium]|nr:FkbM family methyltransferase [Actinomycetota bacterium]